MGIKYLNTDLVLESKADLSKIVEEFGKAVIVLHHGKGKSYWHAAFEIARGRSEINRVINSLCALVEEFSKEARLSWDECRSRVFDIGYENDSSPGVYQAEIKPATIQRVAALNASIVISVYSGSVEVGKSDAGAAASDRIKPAG